MKKVSNIETKKLENLYKLNKLTELENETKKLLQIESNNIILFDDGCTHISNHILLCFVRFNLNPNEFVNHFMIL